MMYWTGHDPGWGAWLVMAGGMLAFWGLVMLAVVSLFRSQESGAGTAPVPVAAPPPERPVSAAECVLEDRLAAGAITVEEFRVLRAELTTSFPPTGHATTQPESTPSTASTAEHGATRNHEVAR